MAKLPRMITCCVALWSSINQTRFFLKLTFGPLFLILDNSNKNLPQTKVVRRHHFLSKKSTRLKTLKCLSSSSKFECLTISLATQYSRHALLNDITCPLVACSVVLIIIDRSVNELKEYLRTQCKDWPVLITKPQNYPILPKSQ